MQSVKLFTKGAAFAGTGLTVEGMRGWLDASTDGGTIAHDLLEHQNGIAAIGTVHDELMALGGFWFVRGQHGNMNSRVSVSDPASIIEPVARECARQLLQCIPYGARNPAKPAKWVPVSEAERELPNRWDDGLLVIADHIAYASTLQCDYLKALTADALHYLRKGCRLASERHGDARMVNQTYFAIRDALHPHCASARAGEEFLLTYGSGEAHCTRTKDAPPQPAVGRKWNLPKFYGKQPENLPRPKSYKPKVHGPANAQRNVYREARYA